MKIWVTRAEMEQANAEIKAALEQGLRDLRAVADKSEWFKTELDRADARYSDLMASYRLLKLQGFTEVPKAPDVPRETKQADPVKEAVSRACHGDAALYGAMMQQVAHDRQVGMSDPVILDRIARGTRLIDDIVDPAEPTSTPESGS